MSFTPEELEELRIFDAQIDAEFAEYYRKGAKKYYELHKAERQKKQREYYAAHREEILAKKAARRPPKVVTGD